VTPYNIGNNFLGTELVRGDDDANFVPFELLTDLAGHFEEDDMLEEAFTEAFQDMSQKLSKMDMMDDYQPHLNVRGLEYGCWKGF